MIVVKIELWPGGRGETEALEIGRAAIVNISPLHPVCDYIVVGRDSREVGPQRIVRGHRRDDGIWPLLSRAFAPGSPRRLPKRWREAGQLISAKAGLSSRDNTSES